MKQTVNFKLILLIVIVTSILSSCSSSNRITLPYYKDDDFRNKSIMLISPISDNIKIDNPIGVGVIRGVDERSVKEVIFNEFTSEIPSIFKLDLENEINILHFYKQSVAGFYPINLVADFDSCIPKNWDKMNLLNKNGNIDYFIVIDNLRISNQKSSIQDKDKVGNEITEFNYSLLDLKLSKVISSGFLKVEKEFPRTVNSTLLNLVDEFCKKLPFPRKNK
ncbi:MAG: hypothetical protein IPP08_05755 [Chlorobiota bacterium]|nr:hypothetical protein [Chlorobiota bacterium]QQS67667.1 MAG: hypothetical protein IPP08_05755 [Chlorobiota bacterium]